MSGGCPARVDEGALALVVLALLSAFAFVSPVGSWVTFVPIAVLFPVLLWVAARGRPLFAAAAAFIVAVGLVSTTTFGIGRFGDPSTAILERVRAAQVAMLVTTLCALVLAALFAERRRSEAALKAGNERLQDSNERLQLALGGAELGRSAWILPPATSSATPRVACIHGHSVPPTTIKEGRRFIHPDQPGAHRCRLRGGRAQRRRLEGRIPGGASARPPECRRGALGRVRGLGRMQCSGRARAIARRRPRHHRAQARGGKAARAGREWNGACSPKFLPVFRLPTSWMSSCGRWSRRPMPNMMVSILIRRQTGKASSARRRAEPAAGL